MRIGIDFGTTNSGAAARTGGYVRVLPLDRVGSNPTVIPTTLYITREHEISIGREAIETYYRQNIGRPSKMVRRYVGEIEMVFAELPPIVKQVYVLIDEMTPGRLLRSVKSGLASSYEGTVVMERYYRLEDLIALYLGELRQRAEAQLGQTVDGVVLGRPVNFVGSAGRADNERAQERLRLAAGMAGFRDIDFELEPIAAALSYESQVKQPQNIVVFDFGGGTLDITVMRVDPRGRQRQVFASGGVGIAGNMFDQRIVENLLLEHLGRGSTWGRDGDVFPDTYTDALTNWQTVLDLNRPEVLHFLQLAQLTSSHPARVRALESLLVNNYAVRMFDEVERAKIALSDEVFNIIRLSGPDIHVWQPVGRAQLESMIEGEARRIEACLLDTLARSGLEYGEIEAVVRTGGSAQVPRFVELLERYFPGRVVQVDVFGSVTAGLGIRAAQLS